VRWRKDGTGLLHRDAVSGSDLPNVFTPDGVMAGAKLSGPVVVFDDDHYYMGAVIAEALRRDGLSVVLVTPASRVCAWAEYTTEQERSHARLLELDVDLVTEKTVVWPKISSSASLGTLLFKRFDDPIALSDNGFV